MATTPQDIRQIDLPTSLTTVYTFPASGPTRGVLEWINFCNKTTTPVKIGLALVDGSGNVTYIFKNFPLPSEGVISLTGLGTLHDTSGSRDRVQAICDTASSVDVVGTVIENA